MIRDKYAPKKAKMPRKGRESWQRKGITERKTEDGSTDVYAKENRQGCIRKEETDSLNREQKRVNERERPGEYEL